MSQEPRKLFEASNIPIPEEQQLLDNLRNKETIMENHISKIPEENLTRSLEFIQKYGSQGTAEKSLNKGDPREALRKLDEKFQALKVEEEKKKLMARHKQEEVIRIAKRIGQFFLKLYNGDYEKATEEIILLRIMEIKVVGDEIEIHTSRPGLLIGRRGENISKLCKFLQARVKIKEVMFDIVDWLIPQKDEE